MKYFGRNINTRMSDVLFACIFGISLIAVGNFFARRNESEEIEVLDDVIPDAITKIRNRFPNSSDRGDFIFLAKHNFQKIGYPKHDDLVNIQFEQFTNELKTLGCRLIRMYSWNDEIWIEKYEDDNIGG